MTRFHTATELNHAVRLLRVDLDLLSSDAAKAAWRKTLSATLRTALRDRDMLDRGWFRDEDAAAKVHASPSGRYALAVSRHATTPESWGVSRGDVTKNGRPLATVYRNYYAFPFAFVEAHPTGLDYLVCGADYQGITVVRLADGARVDHDDGFCWVSITPSPDGTLLAVEGCDWGGPYETAIYDFAFPARKPAVLFRDEASFDGWTGPSTCALTDLRRELFTPDADAPPEASALAGKTLDEMTEAEVEVVDAEERRVGHDLFVQPKCGDRTWSRASGLGDGT